MSYVDSFVLGDTQYTATMASAADQDKLMSLLSAALIERAVVMGKQGQSVGDEVLVPMFMAMPHDRKVQVAGILTKGVSVTATKTAIDIEHFRTRLVQYNQLLARLLRWNLGDFFTYLADVVSAEARPAPQTPVL